MTEVAKRLQEVRDRIAAAAQRAGRNPAEVALLAVSKTFPQDPIREAFAAGQVHFGENRIQEAHHKVPLLSDLQAEWHLIGHLQGNKARRAVQLFDVIQTLDSVKITRRVGLQAAQIGKRIRVYAQVELAGETQKSGVAPEDLDTLLEEVSNQSCLDLEGLMCIPPWSTDPEMTRPYFKKLARLLDGINQHRARPLKGLSMGMSNDFAVAIEEGSTLVRVGTAIFGSRQKTQP